MRRVHPRGRHIAYYQNKIYMLISKEEYDEFEKNTQIYINQDIDFERGAHLLDFRQIGKCAENKIELDAFCPVELL